MYARVTSFPGLAPERITATLAEFEQQQLPVLEKQDGFRGVWAGVDRNAGRAMAVTFWETLEDLRASDELGAKARQTVSGGESDPGGRLVWEVVVDDEG